MTDVAYIESIKDILKCMCQPSRSLTDGWLLADFLLDEPLRKTTKQEHQMLSALRTIIEQQLLK